MDNIDYFMAFYICMIGFGIFLSFGSWVCDSAEYLFQKFKQRGK